MSNLSDHMIEALRLAGSDPEDTLKKFPGGYWAPPGAKHTDARGVRRPAEYAKTVTIKALRRRGLVERMNEGEYPALITLTDRGREALENHE